MNKKTQTTHLFYLRDQLSIVSQDQQHCAIFRAEKLPLAEHQTPGSENTRLLATDDKRSALTVVSTDEDETHAYTAYGHSPTLPSAKTLHGFNGERLEVTTENYALGNGYRMFSPTLMRFYSPDSLSPFDEGGFNAYCYCGDDPINRIDPDGHTWYKPWTWFSSKPKVSSSNSHLQARQSENGRQSSPQVLTAQTPTQIQNPSSTTLPAYSASAPSNHFTVDKAPNLKLADAKNLEEQSHKATIQANRQALNNIGKKLKGKKVSDKSVTQTRILRERAKIASEQAIEIRNSPGVAQPPAYQA